MTGRPPQRLLASTGFAAREKQLGPFSRYCWIVSPPRSLAWLEVVAGSLHIFASNWMAWQVPVNAVRHQSLLFSSI